MAPKTRFTEQTNKEGAPEKKKKNESVVEKKKAAVEKKKAEAEKKKKDSVIKKKQAAVKRRREAVKKKRDAEKKKIETAEKKRKRDSGVDDESSSNPTKRPQTASSPEHQADPDHYPPLSTELPSQDDREGTPSPSVPIEPQKSPTQTPNEAENPLQAPITSTNRESGSPEAAINNDGQTIGSNNIDSNSHEAAIGSAAIDNDAPRTTCWFFFNPSNYGKGCKLSSRCHQHDFRTRRLVSWMPREELVSRTSSVQAYIPHGLYLNKKSDGIVDVATRTMHTEKGRQAWFGVNGVPIRYSIGEHSLLSRFISPLISRKLSSIGRLKFARKYFKVKKTKDGKEKGLQVMTDDGGSLLSATALRGRSKAGYFIEYFLLKHRDVFLFNVDTEDGDEQSTLQIMAAWTRADEVVDDDALEKEGEVRVDDALENTAGWRFTGSC
ncbi:hypothetical protein Bca52824_004319 [Brassica carinata]|uniref:Uncharacterized protein n=1 Tax=Brassica carinata TaxID=52824 RepID=A0A8X7WNW7_BRACI|nr:hypothetical protein Bca52824_004319 [Brassica carinata]